MSQPTLATVLLATWLLTWPAACAGPKHPRHHDADYPGQLLPPKALGHDVLWQQRVTASWGDGEQRGFDAAIQQRADTLLVLGLSPMGTAGFTLQLRDGQVTMTNQTDMEVPFPPRFVVLDVQRVFFPWLPAGPTADGEVEGIVGDERVAEVRRGGRLVERRFRRLDDKPPGIITVTYDWSASEATRLAPRRAELVNGWFGYRLTVDTHTETILSEPPK